MGSNEARIRLGVDGANESRNAIRGVKGELAGIEGISGKVAGGLKDIAASAVRLGVDFAKAAANMQPINFAAAADKFKDMDDRLTRMAVKGGKNVDDLRIKFKDFGSQAGVGTGRFAEAVKEFDKMTFSGLDDAATSVKDLGIAAEDADTSLEEMLSLGEDMYAKLGVPAQRIGLEFKRMKEMAADMNLPGGLGNMANIMARLMQGGGNRVAGGPQRLGAMLQGLIEQGYSPAVAAEQQEKIMGAINQMPQHLVRRSIRSLPGVDKHYEPYVRDPITGRVQAKDETYEYLQRVYDRAPNTMGALMGVFGTGAEGMETAQAFRNLNYKRVRDIQTLPDRMRAGGAVRLDDIRAGGTVATIIKEQADEMLGKKPAAGSEFSRTSAGQRIRTDQEKRDVEMKVGRKVQELRDARDASYKGKRGTQAVVDTVTGALPEWAAGAINLGAAADAHASTQRAPIEVHISSRSVDSIAQTLRENPPVIRRNPVGAAQDDARTPK